MGTGRKLLLADDSITIQKVVNLTFADEGLEVTTVSDGDQAMAKIEESVPDIVLADVHMPGLNGYEVCEHIKRNERFRHVPVMLLVGSFEPFDEAEARRVGADDFLTKPFQSIRQLVSKVSALLSGKSDDDDEAPTRDISRAAQTVAAQGLNVVGDAPPAANEIAATQDASFADLGLDDALIEETPGPDASLNRTINSKPRPTTPLSAAELKEAGINLNQYPSNQMYETLRMNVPEELNNTIAPPPEAAPVAPGSRPFAGVAVAEDSLLDLGEIESPHAAAAEDSILDIYDDEPEAASVAEASLTTAQSGWATPVDTAAVAPVEYQGEVAEAPPAEAAEYVEAQVVEAEPEAVAPPVAGPQTGTVEPEDRQMSETAPLAESQAAQSAPTSSATEQPAAQANAGLITLDQLAPEVIDAIARRAVEQLSEKVIEQIAWEVVPQLSELLIKRRLEEESSQPK